MKQRLIFVESSSVVYIEEKVIKEKDIKEEVIKEEASPIKMRGGVQNINLPLLKLRIIYRSINAIVAWGEGAFESRSLSLPVVLP